ncbi:hypothetical protein G4B88_014467, partial [Cannabis sativa]
ISSSSSFSKWVPPKSSTDVSSDDSRGHTIDIPMAQFIINMNAALPASQKFIIHVLDNTHLFVQPHAAEMIRSAVQEFRDQNSYEKPN